MRIRRPALVLAVLLIPAVAGADDHFADLYAAFSYIHGSDLFGFHGSAAKTLPIEKWSVLGDFSVHSGSDDENDLTHVMGGVRYAFVDQGKPKGVPFVHWLIGGVNTDDNAENGTEWAAAFGAGWEYLPGRRADSEGWGIRVQGDLIVPLSGDADSYPRLSAGVVYRFKKETKAEP